MEIVAPLGDYKVMEKESITLTCEVSKPDRAATWMKDGKPLPKDRFTTKVEGCKHTLTITNAHLDDESKYTIKVEGAESTGKLSVEGTLYIIY